MKKYTCTIYQIQTERTRFLSERAADQGVSAAFLSDLHNCVDKEETDVIFDMLQRENPDIVLCGGDMLIARPGISPEKAVRFMEKLCKKYKVYCANGNHEYRARIYPETYGDLYSSYQKELKNSGAVLLENQYEEVNLAGLKTILYGFEMDRIYYKRFRYDKMPVQDLEKYFGNVRKDVFSVLLAHNPNQLDSYMRWGADLTLCGHYHGGVFRFGEHHGLITPDFHLFSGYVHGRYQAGEQNAIISAGIGEHTIPFRIHNPRELVILKITGKKQAGAYHND